MNKTKKQYLALKTDKRDQQKERDVLIDVSEVTMTKSLLDKNIKDDQMKIEEDFPDHFKQNRVNKI